MKKRTSKLAALICTLAILAMCLGGCKKVECDFCGETKKCQTMEVFGEKVNICKDCKADLDALGSLFK